MFLFVFFSLLQQPTFSYNHIGINQNYIVRPQIVSVVDGDTIKIRLKERDTGFRLTNIDSYETSANNQIKYQHNDELTDEQITEKGLRVKQKLIKILRSHKKYNHIGENPNYIMRPQIVSVVDGDTIKIRLKERDTGVRLTGIDCYETSVNKHIKYQRNKGLTDEQIIEKGLMAKQELIKILRSHKNIYLEITGVDHYSRLVGIFYYKDKKGHYVSINDEMMNTGYCPQFIYNAKRK